MDKVQLRDNQNHDCKRIPILRDRRRKNRKAQENHSDNSCRVCLLWMDHSHRNLNLATLSLDALELAQAAGGNRVLPVIACPSYARQLYKDPAQVPVWTMVPQHVYCDLYLGCQHLALLLARGLCARKIPLSGTESFFHLYPQPQSWFPSKC